MINPWIWIAMGVVLEHGAPSDTWSMALVTPLLGGILFALSARFLR